MSDFRVLRFAIIVCLGCSVVLSAAAIGLRDRQQANLILDQRRNILKSVGLFQPEMAEEELNATYNERMVGLVVRADGSVVEGRNPTELDPEQEPDLLPVYQRVDDGEVAAYTIPVSGKGLWSTLYGYFALDADLNTVRGITFYQHGETPGLGGEIDKPWFQENFVGKKILDDAGNLRSITVVKGTAADRYPDPDELVHYVDGISGATITSNGVTALLEAELTRYRPYFETLRNGMGRTT